MLVLNFKDELIGLEHDWFKINEIEIVDEEFQIKLVDKHNKLSLTVVYLKREVDENWGGYLCYIKSPISKTYLFNEHLETPQMFMVGISSLF